MTTQAEPLDATTARYQIGEVADRTGVTQRTLRFYEEKGLLRPPERMDGGFRLYSTNDITRIGYIKQLQDLLGFTLSEIKDMVEAEDLLLQMSATRRPDRELPERLQRSEQILDYAGAGATSAQREVAALAESADKFGHELSHPSPAGGGWTRAIASGRVGFTSRRSPSHPTALGYRLRVLHLRNADTL